MAMPVEIEAAAEVLYGPEWSQTLDPRGKDEARALARKVLELAEEHRDPLLLPVGLDIRSSILKPGTYLSLEVEV